MKKFPIQMGSTERTECVRAWGGREFVIMTHDDPLESLPSSKHDQLGQMNNPSWSVPPVKTPVLLGVNAWMSIITLRKLRWLCCRSIIAIDARCTSQPCAWQKSNPKEQVSGLVWPETPMASMQTTLGSEPPDVL